MIPTDPVEQAALIMTAGKQLRDWTLRVQSAQCARSDEQLAFGELSMSQSLAVMAVKDHGPLSITGLAELLAVSAPSASAMVDRLVERGLLTREPDPDDRRRVQVRLSPEADRNYNQTLSVILNEFLQILLRLGPEMSARWCEVMVTVKGIIDSDPPAVRPPDGERGDS